MQKIVDYLRSKYQPETIIVYGSFADGSNGPGSDFDALLLTDHMETNHDDSVVDGKPLDVFLYPTDAQLDPSDFPQLYYCKLVHDTCGKGRQLIDRAVNAIENRPMKTKAEILDNLSWCDKMLHRTQRGDAEGYYRWHWVLCDSLEYYCDIRGKFYFGPKKTLQWMQQEDPEAFLIYSEALSCLEWEKLKSWVKYLRSQMEG